MRLLCDCLVKGLRTTLRSSNPVMTSLTRGTSTESGYSYNYNNGQERGGYGGSIPPLEQSSQRPITVDDVVTKTGLVLGIIIAVGAAVFALGTVNPVAAQGLALVGAIGGFITVLVFAFGKKYGSAPVSLTYAVFEGMFVGGFTFLFAASPSGMTIVSQAILATVGVFIGMLVIYKTGAVKVTPRFNKWMFAFIGGVAVLSIGNLLLALIFGINPLRGDGMIALVFSLVCIVLASLSFLSDFDEADRLIRAGAPAECAWGVALGLAVTLVWLYTEILRLLSRLNND